MKQNVVLVGALDFPHIPRAGDTVKNRYLLEFFKGEISPCRIYRYDEMEA